MLEDLIWTHLLKFNQIRLIQPAQKLVHQSVMMQFKSSQIETWLLRVTQLELVYSFPVYNVHIHQFILFSFGLQRAGSGAPAGLSKASGAEGMNLLILHSAAHSFRSLGDGLWSWTAGTPGSHESLLLASSLKCAMIDGEIQEHLILAVYTVEGVRPIGSDDSRVACCGASVRLMFADKSLAARLRRNSTWNAQMTRVIGWEFKTS